MKTITVTADFYAPMAVGRGVIALTISKVLNLEDCALGLYVPGHKISIVTEHWDDPIDIVCAGVTSIFPLEEKKGLKTRLVISGEATTSTQVQSLAMLQKFHDALVKAGFRISGKTSLLT